MLWKLLAAPRWIVGGTAALIVFLGYSIGFKLTKDLSWTHAVVIGAAGAVVVFLAVVTGLTLRRRELRAVEVDQLSPVQQEEAYRSARRGAMHPEPEVQAAALRIANHWVRGGGRQRLLLVVAAVLVAVAAVANLATGNVSSGVFGVITVIALGVLVRQWVLTRRRAAELVRASDES